jgi:hypothetical protein
MYFFIYAVVTAVIAYLGLSLGGVRHRQTKVTIATLMAVFVGWYGWVNMPVFAWNYESNWTILLFVGAFLISISANFRNPASPVSPLLYAPVVLALLMLIPVNYISTWGLFHADDYREILGEPTVSTFDADVSPVDTTQIRRVDQYLAYNLGSKRIEEQPGLGSRVNLGAMNIQTVDGCFDILDGNEEEHNLCFENELVWIGPLVHTDFLKWFNHRTTPGYVIVSAIDPTEVFLVTATKKYSKIESEDGEVDENNTVSQTKDFKALDLRYLRGSYFSDYLNRHVRTNGYVSDGLIDYSFEIDNTGRPFWVISQYERKIGFGGFETSGVILVDVQSGDINEYSIESAPEWVDRIQPQEIITTQINNWGKYVNGFWNSVFAKLDVVQTTPGMSLVYGSDGRSYWYSGIQSAGSDRGTNSFVLVDTRTKEIRRYMIAGANESAARSSAENAPGVREAGFRGTDPILYNTAGEPTYFLTLKGGDGLVKMFAFVSVKNYETVGVGQNVAEALRNYQNTLIREGQGVNLQDLTTQVRIEGVISKAIQIDNTFYILLRGHNNVEFYGTNDVSPELKWASAGENVVLFVQSGDLKSQQIIAFDIPSLDISDLKED